MRDSNHPNTRHLTAPGRLLVGANYHPHDSDPATWRRDAAMMQESGLRIVRLGHLAWDSFEPADGDFRFDWFDEAMDVMHEHGIGVILDIAVRPAPLWLHRKHPTIGVIDPDGSHHYPNHRYTEDAGDPHFREHALRFTDRLTRRYTDHPALAAFGIDNEPGDGPISYSPTVLTRFKTWLKAKYGDLGALNRAWASQRWSRRIGDFDEIGLPRPGVAGGAPERILDFRRFVSDEMNGYLAAVSDVVEANAPHALTTSNMWYYAPSKHFDWAAGAYGRRLTRPGNGFYPSGSLMDTDSVRDALFGIARIRYEQPDPFWCTEFTTMTAAPGSIRRSAYASLMLGNQLVCGWTWQTMHAGEEQFLQGMIDWDGEPTRKLDEYRQIATEFRTIETHGFPYNPKADIAIALDFASQIAWAALPESHDDQALTAFRTVLDRNLDVRIVDLERSELDYKILIVPGLLVLSERAADAIRAFVARGGTAIMTADSASLYTDGRAFRATRPGRLAEVFGIRVGACEEPRLLSELNGRKGTDDVQVLLGERRLTTESPRFDLIESRGAAILGTVADLDREYPAVTANRYGDGTAIYIGLPARTTLLGSVLDTETERLAVRPGPSAPEGVMARAITDRHHLYLNLDAEPKTIDLPRTGRGVLSEQHLGHRLVLAPWDAELVAFA
ncbi:MAG: beta-galactosidase [Glycomyces artemisiae]|uniref:beta-galactosidase n=1 Tax=Glycomyces artemisiae TaxID=1076443 RepID=A0A850CG89_9ACTN|nr:beta-galactosidase [Glycomyces artemisiae]